MTEDWFRPAAQREQRQEFTEAFVDATHSERRRSPLAKRAIIAVATVVVAGGACVGIGALVSGQHSAPQGTGPTIGGAVAAVTPAPRTTSPRPTASRSPAHVGQSATPASPAPVAVIQSPQSNAPATHAPAAPAPATHTPTRQPSRTPTPASGPFNVGGEISCTSGQAVVGVWVAAAKGSGYSPWTGQGNGSTASFSYTLPVTEAYSIHVGCGGTGPAWQVATYSNTVTSADNNFVCDDVTGQAAYGTCSSG